VYQADASTEEGTSTTITTAAVAAPIANQADASTEESTSTTTTTAAAAATTAHPADASTEESTSTTITTAAAAATIANQAGTSTEESTSQLTLRIAWPSSYQGMERKPKELEPVTNLPSLNAETPWDGRFSLVYVCARGTFDHFRSTQLFAHDQRTIYQ
jgi:hypothetical protein